MKYFKKISGKKCYLSPINPEDVEKYMRWLNDPEVSQYLTLAAQVIALQQERETLQRLSKGGYNFAIVDSETDELIGGCGLLDADMINRTAELGIFIGDKAYWNKGYGEEALRLLLDFAFNILNLNNVLLKVFSFNQRALACYKKCGFKEIGRRRKARIMSKHAYDTIYMDILAEEFEGSFLPKTP